MTQPTYPKQLPWCTYPTSSDIHLHGLLELPKHLPLVDFESAREFRSNQYHPISVDKLDNSRILELTQVIASSFVINEPMNRHLNPPTEYPKAIHNHIHTDPLGSHSFGHWTKENIFFWFIRLMVLTDPSSPLGDIQLNKDLLKLSLAIGDKQGQLIGGAYNITLEHPDSEHHQRTNDPILNTIAPFIGPPLSLVIEQEHLSIEALHHQYPDFKEAHLNGKVGCHFLVARSNLLPAEDTFELVAASAEHFLKLDYKYLVITATNVWTGAACEVLGGLRVHFTPYRADKRVLESKNARADEVHSPDGYISDKDSGSMFYLIKLQ